MKRNLSQGWAGQPQWANRNIQKNERARRWQILKNQLDKGKLPPLQEYLVTETCEEWDKMFNGNRARGYTIGYSLFDFFMSTPNSQAFLATLLKQPDVEAGGLPALERGWHEWIRRKAELEKGNLTPKK
ncbi:MAG: hypothetical protein HZA89_18135 [Verrucomicrobia bacterium]|nr:hypothetical protein [Verrucomicrobiota bacterium]